MTASHVPGHTTSTATRVSQDFTATTHVHELEQGIEALLVEARANSSRRAAMTLSKDPSLSVVMMAIQSGAELRDHRAHGSALLQNLRGRLTVQLEDKEMELGPGEAISIAGGVPHRLAAVEDTVVLLVVAGPEG